MRRLIFILLFCRITIDMNAQLNERMDLVSNLRAKDSTIFSVQTVGCFSSGSLNIFKLVKVDSDITLYYLKDSLNPRKIKLNARQLKLLRKIEKKQHTGSTTHDKYRVTRGTQTITRSRDTK